jgi:hypothetical protein
MTTSGRMKVQPTAGRTRIYNATPAFRRELVETLLASTEEIARRLGAAAGTNSLETEGWEIPLVMEAKCKHGACAIVGSGTTLHLALDGSNIGRFAIGFSPPSGSRELETQEVWAIGTSALNHGTVFTATHWLAFKQARSV